MSATSEILKDFLKLAEKTADPKLLKEAQAEVLEKLAAVTRARKATDVADFSPLGYSPREMAKETKRLQDAGLLPDVETAEKNGLMPPAYKVLTEDGTSPWAPQVKWSLPTQQADKSWLAGDWKKAELNLPLNPGAKDVARQPGVYVTDSPMPWRDEASLLMKKSAQLTLAGQSEPMKLKVFVAEVGDEPSKFNWLAGFSRYNFRAESARLLRPATTDELSRLQREYRIGDLGPMGIGRRLTER
jgi:hypothetical protein